MLSEKEQESDTVRFWQFIRKNSRALIIYAFIGGIAAFIVTLFIAKEYKAYGMVYTPSSTSIDNSIDFPNFGYDVEADRLIQILESSELRDSVVNRFNLAGYYEADKSKPDWKDELVKRYHKDVKFERTPSMAVMISARNKDPERAAAIVNFIIATADGLREKIYKRNIVPAYESAKADYELQKHAVDSLQTLLAQKLRENNLSSLLILLSDAQISIDLDKLNAIGATAANSSLGPDMIVFKSAYDVFKEYKARFIKVRKTFTNPIPKLYVINYAEPVYKKISPSLSINTAIGALFALFVATVILLLRHNSETR